jgi:hypothetical protein
VQDTDAAVITPVQDTDGAAIADNVQDTDGTAVIAPVQETDGNTEPAEGIVAEPADGIVYGNKTDGVSDGAAVDFEPADRPYESTVSATVSVGRAPGLSGARAVWGRLITALREGNHFLLHAAACDKTFVREEGGFLTLVLRDDSDYKLFSRPESVAALDGLLAAFSDLRFRAELYSPHKGTDVNAVVRRLEEVVGAGNVKVKR